MKEKRYDQMEDDFRYFIDGHEPLYATQKAAKGKTKKKRVGHGS